MSYKIEKINSPNQSSRGSYKPELIVCHIAEGYYEGTKSWFLQTASQTSSHYILGQNGEICESVPIDKMAWCNGTTTVSTDKRFYGFSTVPLVKQKGGNANQYSISIECEGFHSKTKGALTDKQLNALVWLIKKIQTDVKAKYNITISFDREHIVGHYQINPKTKPYCPGEAFQWDILMNRLNGNTDSNTLTTTSNTGNKIFYRVQVGAFSNKVNAQTFLKNVKAKGYSGSFLVKPTNDNLYRVQVGSFSVKTNAEAFMKEVQSKGMVAIIKEYKS